MKFQYWIVPGDDVVRTDIDALYSEIWDDDGWCKNIHYLESIYFAGDGIPITQAQAMDMITKQHVTQPA